MTALLWLSLGLVAYTYAGYPLGLWLVGKLAPRPVRKQPVSPEVVMIVVAHNEAHRILSKIDTCLSQHYPADRLKVLVVSDGSTDGTENIVAQHPDPRVSLLRGAGRRGKAACLNDGVRATQAPIIVFTDARQRLHPEAVARLLTNFADERVGAASGELEFENEDGSPFAEGMGAYWLYEKFIRSQEAVSGSVVGVTGALYALRRECFQPIPAETILDDVAIPMVAAMKGWRVVFEKGALAYDRPSTDPGQEQVRKVRTLAGNFQLLALYPRLLWPQDNPLWWRFVSHKLMRLAGPFALLVALLANGLLASQHDPFFVCTWWIQVAAYGVTGLALIFPALQKTLPIKLAVTFAHLNWFVLLGLQSFLRSKQSHLWEKSTPKS